MAEGKDQSDKKWLDDAEESLNRTGDALKAAWEETREARVSTLESAREAANRLGRAIDQGIKTAKETWDAPRREESTPDRTEEEEEE